MFCKISKLNAIKEPLRQFMLIYMGKTANNNTELALRHDNFDFFCNFALRKVNYK